MNEIQPTKQLSYSMALCVRSYVCSPLRLSLSSTTKKVRVEKVESANVCLPYEIKGAMPSEFLLRHSSIA